MKLCLNDILIDKFGRCGVIRNLFKNEIDTVYLFQLVGRHEGRYLPASSLSDCEKASDEDIHTDVVKCMQTAITDILELEDYLPLKTKILIKVMIAVLGVFNEEED